MTDLDRELLSTILATEVAGIAIDQQLDPDLYNEIYGFLLKTYANADESILLAIQNKILN